MFISRYFFTVKLRKDVDYLLIIGLFMFKILSFEKLYHEVKWMIMQRATYRQKTKWKDSKIHTFVYSLTVCKICVPSLQCLACDRAEGSNMGPQNSHGVMIRLHSLRVTQNARSQ